VRATTSWLPLKWRPRYSRTVRRRRSRASCRRWESKLFFARGKEEKLRRHIWRRVIAGHRGCTRAATAHAVWSADLAMRWHRSVHLPPPQVHRAECQLGCSEPAELARNSRPVANGDAVAWLSGSCPTAHGAHCALQSKRRFDMRAGLYWRPTTTVVVPPSAGWVAPRRWLSSDHRVRAGSPIRGVM
jgi:hypothetical protein